MTGDTGAPTTAELIRRMRPERQETGLRGRLVVTVVVLATFGPYVFGGLRTEQLAVYGLLATIGFVQIASLQIPRLPGRAWLLFGAWATYATLALAAGFGEHHDLRWPTGDLLAGVDNLAGPLAVLLLVWSTVTLAGAQRALELAAKLVALCMAANGVLAMVMTRVDLADVLRPFWSSAGGGTTADNAVTLGRFSGVFNQPVEAGLAYGLAGLCAWYVWRNRPSRMYLVLIPIVLGGLISVSKVFVLGGLPLILWLVWRSRKAGSRLGLLFVTAGLAFGLAQSGYASQWAGMQYLSRLLSPGNEEALSFFTAGRLGESSTLSRVFEEVARVSPWWGVGPEGLQVPYDNGWVEAFVVAGLCGFVLYTLTLLVIWRVGRTDPDPARRTLMTAVAILAAGSSLGVPALTANRASTLLWLIIALAIAAATFDRGGAGDSSDQAARTMTL